MVPHHAGLIALAMGPFVGILVWIAVRYALQFALARGVNDVPNERSSHTRPTPRGGGVGFVAVFLGCVVALWFSPLRDTRLCLALLTGGAAVAAVGAWDDVQSLSARARLFVHFGAAILGLILLDRPLSIGVPLLGSVSGTAAAILAAFFIVWSINSFNFMDGIDGIAASQAVFVTSALAWLATRANDGALVLANAAVAASVVGFLVWNWHPARIFMGDVGSGFLGFLLALLAVWGHARGAYDLWTCLIVMGAFLLDATYTLLRRLLAGQNVAAAHRDHTYQHAVQAGHSHARVTLAYTAVNVGWLLPLAALHEARRDWTWLVLVAYAPLLCAAIVWRAGIKPADA